MTRHTLFRLARVTLLVIVIAGPLWALGCAEDVQFLTSKNDVRVVSVPDTFKVDAKDLENVYDTIDTTWVITGPQAHVNHRSFVPHGQSEVTIRDAAGAVVYHRDLLFEIEAVTDSGVAGAWEVTINLYGTTGRVGLTLTKEP
jgi:hypothetical protein